MSRRGVLAIGLDCFEISLAERLVGQGMLPALAARREHDAHLLLDPGADQRTGLAWEQFWSGLSATAAHRQSAVEFNPATYTVWQEGARFQPFFADADADVQSVVFDAPYVDLEQAPGVQGVVAWGAHDPGLDGPVSRPRCLLRELESRVGPYVGGPWVYGTPWASTDDTARMGRDLAASVDARSRAAQWLLAERVPEWDLAVVSEPHSGAEGLWHGVDAAHPLHDAPSAHAAGDGLTEIYRATDRLVGDLVQATDPKTVVIFSMGGMGPNGSDAVSMVLLPKLLLRWSLGEHRLEPPAAWAAAPTVVPVGDEAQVEWSRSWFRGAAPEAAPTPGLPAAIRGLASLLPESTRRRLQRARAQRRASGHPVGYRTLDWMPAAWYADRWPAMRAFALPSFYDGRIRINLRGRETAGLVDLADYDRVCDELEELLRSCIDPRTGQGVVESIERPIAEDPSTLDRSVADLVVVWTGCPVALTHAAHGTVGPVPYRRTGGHTGPFGFASVTGPGVVPGDHGIADALDIAPTVSELVTGRAPHGLSGRSLAPTLTGASAVAP